MLLVNPLHSSLSINHQNDRHLMMQPPILSNVSTKSNTPEESFCDDIFELEMERCEGKSFGTVFLGENGMPSNKEILEIDVKPKRKIFQTAEEKRKYVEDYKKKIKTELCKNWVLKGTCKFGDKCCFAHGKEELKEKKHLHLNYKTKPCKQYFYKGYCAYGYRCQYIHSELKYLPEFKNFIINAYKEKNIPFSKYLFSSESPEAAILQNIAQTCQESATLEEILSKMPSSRTRLPIFDKICSSAGNSNISMQLN